MLHSPFLTQLDSRAAIKGSRDPLAVQTTWSRLGRLVVGNLTTVTTSLPDFVTLLLGHYLAEQAERADAVREPLALFLRWEQLAAYARASVNGETGFRGTERVWRNLHDDPKKVRLGVDASAQILSSQRTYGLWGLYTAAARASGLLEGDPVRLTRAAREFVEAEYVPALATVAGRGAQELVRRLAKPESVLLLQGKDHALLEAVAKLLGRALGARERAFFAHHLVRGGSGDVARTQGVQRAFATVLRTTLSEPDWTLTPGSVAELAQRAQKDATHGATLAGRLERIRTCELLIAPAAALFEFTLGCHDRTPKEVAQRLREHWGEGLGATIDLTRTAALEADLGADDAEAGARWMKLAQALASGDYEAALTTAIAQNTAVMHARGGAAAWVEVRRGKLDVRFRDPQAEWLPSAAELPSYWRHAYFVDALRRIAGAVGPNGAFGTEAAS